jgi:cell division protease FtsH
MDNNSNKNKQNNNKKNQMLIILVVAVIVTLLIMSIFSKMLKNATSSEITYTKFQNMLEAGEIESILLTANGKIEITPKVASTENVLQTTYWTAQLYDETLLTKIDEYNEGKSEKEMITISAEWENTESSILDFFIYYILPFLIVYLLMYFAFRKIGEKGGGGIMGVGRSNAKVYVQKETGVTFKDVAGQDEAKESLTEIVDFLHNPGKYADVGAKLPKGALLVGPPEQEKRFWQKP